MEGKKIKNEFFEQRKSRSSIHVTFGEQEFSEK